MGSEEKSFAALCWSGLARRSVSVSSSRLRKEIRSDGFTPGCSMYCVLMESWGRLMDSLRSCA